MVVFVIASYCVQLIIGWLIIYNMRITESSTVLVALTVLLPYSVAAIMGRVFMKTAKSPWLLGWWSPAGASIALASTLFVIFPAHIGLGISPTNLVPVYTIMFIIGAGIFNFSVIARLRLSGYGYGIAVGFVLFEIAGLLLSVPLRTLSTPVYYGVAFLVLLALTALNQPLLPAKEA